MWQVHARRLLRDMHRQRLMQQSITYFAIMILLVICWCNFPNHWVLGWWGMSLTKPTLAKTIRTRHDWCMRLWLMLPIIRKCSGQQLHDAHKLNHMRENRGWWYLSLADVTWPKLARHDRCFPVDAHMSWLMYYSIGQCLLTIVHRIGLMSVSCCTHATTDACRPWLLLPSIGRCYFVNLHRPRVI